MILVGTSGWQYDSWRARFYPRGLPARDWLAWYASRFPVVEVNNTFYRLPAEATFERWRDETPAGFTFVLKASRLITHLRRLRDARDAVELLWSRAERLGPKLGPILFQLPPRFPVDPSRLAAFLGVLPKQMRAAFEFRDPSWHRDDVLGLLDRAGAAWVMADRPGARVPRVATGGWAYLRLHQGRADQPGYTRRKLWTWAGRLSELPVREAYAFFNNDELAAAPHDAATLADLLSRVGS